MPTPNAPAKKQQSISSFFTRKTVNGSSKSLPVNSSSVDQLSGEAPSDIQSSDGHVLATETLSVSSIKRPLESDPANGNSSFDRPGKKVKAISDNEDGQSIFVPETSSPRSDARSPAPIKSTNAGSSVSSRTDHFVYVPSQANPDSSAVLDIDDDTRRQKEQLHRKFVKKLGHPDSIAQIKRRGGRISEETSALDEEEADDAEEEISEAAKSKKKGARTGKLTPMEIQMLDIKRKHMDTLLIVEVGYKFRFFGEDARIAAKELSIVCIPGKFRFDEHPSEAYLDKFASASIPVHRLPVHAKRLIAAGHKVGVVRQIETAALKKAGDNRNTPFVRKLTNLYTKGTYIDDIDGLDQTDAPASGAPATGYLLCLTETKTKAWGTDEKVDVGILAVQPGTGDVIYDNFEDGFMRSELETRLLHISPCEFLIVGELSKATEKLVQHLSGSSTNVFGDKIRVERVDKPKTMAAQSSSHVAEFYAEKTQSSQGNKKDSELLNKVIKLCEPVTICLSAMIKHMTEYGLEHVFDLTKYFQSFSSRSHMLLNGNTLTSLEIYRNQTDYAERGSLFWALDKTQTKFGQRLLRKWVGRPLLDKSRLEERTEAIEELKDGVQTARVDKLKSLLMKIKSDLERSLIRIYYGKCTRPELLTVLQTMQRIANEFADVKSPQDAGFRSTMINEAVASLPTMREALVAFLDRINPEAARSDDKYAFFREEFETDAITNHKMGIAAVEQDLEEHRQPAAAKINKKIPITYVTSSGIEYLIEVENSNLRNVPASWVKISGTKKLSRFHTPEVINMLRERDQHKESLAAACDDAFSSLLGDISAQYQSFRDCVNSLAILDCLLSLATVASQPGYVKPSYTSSPKIDIVGGRHPMVEQLLLDTYVPNDTVLSHERTRGLLITGPNMGGKSSYVRQVALICIMAQIGSYVPAESATLGMLDAVYTRMGAFDNMMKGESTFMVELSETSDILKQATPRSLVILDELGRGTSTHDGVAIAQAVLEHIIRDTKCLALFITHYQTLASLEKTFEHGELKNVHMKFVEDGDDITFLYEIGDGVAHRSYGLNVAKLANVPHSILDIAAIKSKELEDEVRGKMMGGLARLLGDVLMKNDEKSLDLLVTGVEQL